MEQKDYLSYTIIEPFTIEPFTIDPSYSQLGSIIKRSHDISGQIWTLYNNDMKNNLDLSGDILDLSGNFVNKSSVVDVARQDAQIMLVQQNSLYMIGTVTIATLLITAILLSK